MRISDWSSDVCSSDLWASLSPSSRWETSIAAFYASAHRSPGDAAVHRILVGAASAASSWGRHQHREKLAAEAAPTRAGHESVSVRGGLLALAGRTGHQLVGPCDTDRREDEHAVDRKSTRLTSSH